MEREIVEISRRDTIFYLKYKIQTADISHDLVAGRKHSLFRPIQVLWDEEEDSQDNNSSAEVSPVRGVTNWLAFEGRHGEIYSQEKQDASHDYLFPEWYHIYTYVLLVYFGPRKKHILRL